MTAKRLTPPLAALLLTAVLLAPAAGAADAITIPATKTSAGSAVLQLAAERLVTMKAIPFTLVIKDAAGQPLRGAKVSCEMTMPSMWMPENRPKVSEQNGAYGGELIFTCAMGAWRIDCLAEGTDGSRQSMTFDIERVSMK